MRKHINLLLSGVLGFGISSVYGADALREGGVEARGGAPISNVARLAMSLEKLCAEEYGITFSATESVASVRFAKGLTGYLDELKSAILASYEAVVSEDDQRDGLSLIEMLKAVEENAVYNGEDDDDSSEGSRRSDDEEADVPADVGHRRAESKVPGLLIDCRERLDAKKAELAAAQRNIANYADARLEKQKPSEAGAVYQARVLGFGAAKGRLLEVIEKLPAEIAVLEAQIRDLEAEARRR